MSRRLRRICLTRSARSRAMRWVRERRGGSGETRGFGRARAEELEEEEFGETGAIEETAGVFAEVRSEEAVGP